ncbi:MAG: hypothetical protein J5984_02710 [Clostridia bacterium]|nr:hypothetical protein [Clostridia bacterium]
MSRKKKKRMTGGTVVKGVILIFALYLLVSYIISLGSNTKEYIAQSGQIEESVSTHGLIFRNQTLVKSPYTGYIEYSISDNQKVRVGERIAYVYENEINPELNNELKEINEKIAKLEARKSETEMYINDPSKIEQYISGEIGSIYRASYDKDFEDIREISTGIESQVSAKKILLGDMKADDTELNNLKAKKKELEANTSNKKYGIYAPISGSFMSKLDGVEEKLTVKAMEELTPKSLNKLDKEKIENKSENKAEKDKNFCKIVDTYKWYYAATIPAKEAEVFSTGESVKLRFSNISGTAVDGKVHRISEEEGGKVVIVISSDKYVESVYSMSEADADIIRRTYSGIRIPSKAIRIKDGVKGVYVVRNSTVKFVEVDVLYADGGWTIVRENKGIKIYDNVIVSGRNLFDGKVL